jgi:glycosyltransferase involved in cell wall biosynthesis
MLSIIISTLNEEKYLPKLLECLNQQHFSEMEIIVSDGASEDHIIQIAKKYECHVVVSKIRSPQHQRNMGAKAARGDLLLFLDADTLLPENFLHKAIDEFNRRKLDVSGFYFDLNSKKMIYRIASLYGHFVN